MARRDFGEAYIRSAYKELLGRDPTQIEIDKVMPTLGNDPNIHNIDAMRSYVAQLADSEQNSPEKIEERKRAERKAKAPEQYGSVDQAFQSLLGRSATTQEKEHFGDLMAGGDIDGYTLNQFLQQLPEYSKKQDEEFRKGLSGELQQQDQQYYSEKVLPSITRDLQRRGLGTESSGYASALALAAQDQNRQREGFLSNLSASQYGNRTANARQDYMDVMNRYYSNQDYARNRNDAMADRNTQRLYEVQNYNMQKQAYDDYLRRYGKRSNGVGQLIGGGIGALVGMKGGPAGVSAGYQAGSGMGSFFG